MTENKSLTIENLLDNLIEMANSAATRTDLISLRIVSPIRDGEASKSDAALPSGFLDRWISQLNKIMDWLVSAHENIAEIENAFGIKDVGILSIDKKDKGAK